MIGQSKNIGPKNQKLTIDIHNILRPIGWIHVGLLPSARGKHFDDCRCHTYYDLNKEPIISSNTGSSDRSTASHQAYEDQWDNWTVYHSSPGTPDSHTPTIATHTTNLVL